MKKINDVRRAHGLRAVGWDRQIGFVARKHAREIANQGLLRHDHNYGSEITRWRRLGQNTGRGSNCLSLYKAFMKSSTHRRNILGHWRFVGVGVAHRKGRMYVQQVFAYRRDPGNIYGTR